MNIEVEIKIEIDNFDEIKQKVAKRGKLIRSINQIDEYYIPCQRDFFAAKPHPFEWLRIRTNPDKTIFEYDLSINKDATGRQECAEEYETGITDPIEFRKILKFLDFKKVVEVNKQRQYWDCGEIEIALDQVKKLGDFIEAEAKGDFKSTAEARTACIKFLEDLGFSDIDHKEILVGYPVLYIERNTQK